MSTAARIAPHLPYLRRFGRALNGTQESGDAYVVALLESFIVDPTSLPRDSDPKITLYQKFIELWNSVDLNHRPTAVDLDTEPSRRSLESITPLPRQAFLLTAVEGFSTAQVAAILGQSAEKVAALLNQAGREIAEQVATDVLIIEDEPLIAMDLESLVTGLGHRVNRMVRTHKEAVAAVRAQPPGLVLADIQLADGSSGIDAVNEILQGINVPVIFITAFPERLLTGDRPEPAFLIAKPFDVNTVRALISQALFFGMKAKLRDGQLPQAN